MRICREFGPSGSLSRVGTRAAEAVGVTLFSKLFSVSAAVLSLFVVACNAGEGESCSNTATYGSGCASGLVCVDATCRAPSQLHEACGDVPCAEGLACGVDGQCVTPGPAGTACTSELQCESGLVCNLAVRTTAGDNGTCRAPAGAGSSCFWSATFPLNRGGCAEGFVCAPSDVDPLAPPAAVATPHASPSDAYAGVCVAKGSVAAGGLCNGDDTCAAGSRCARRDRPTSTVAHAGWSEDAPGLWEYVGVWPNACVAPQP